MSTAGRHTESTKHPRDRGARLRLGIGSHLALGLAVVGAVVLLGHAIANRTSRAAAQAVSSIQGSYEPLVRRSSSIVERLVAYDRSVAECLKTGRPDACRAVELSGGDLTSSLDRYYAAEPDASVLNGSVGLRQRFLVHIADGRDLIEHSQRHGEELQKRRELLEAVGRRISSAGGGGLLIGGTEVVARRSLAELQSAMNALRTAADDEAAASAEKAFASALERNRDDLARSPGGAWLELVREDFRASVQLRRSIAQLEMAGIPGRRRFAEEGAMLMDAAHVTLERPARMEFAGAAERAAAAADEASRVLTLTGIAVLAVVLLVSVLLALSITLPVRRLTAATRHLATGDRTVRARRGGSAEIDELAESFNAMADHIAEVEHELRTQQTQLEQHVAERTEQLHHLAHHDPLTQLPNRRHLAVQLAAALGTAAAEHRGFALLFVDLDNFKSINDTLGHTFGDRVLQGIGARLRQAAGPHAFIARLGGDEFTVLLEDAHTAEAVCARANALIEALQQPLSVDGRVLSTSASIGASLYPDHARDPEALLRAADAALFRAKDLGRNRFVLYTPELYDVAAHQFRLEQSLRRAVEAGDLLLMYQPQVSLHTLNSTAVEALLRWRKPDGRIATASEFIHIAEKSGLMRDLTAWVLRSATSAVTAWRAGGWHHAVVAINVSAPQFFETNFVDHVAQALHVTGLPASALELELTETVMQTGPSTVEALRRLRDMGVAIALDDFGIGYSSLTSLEQLPISRVKLDRTLVEGVDSSPRSAAITRSIIALCHGLGLQVVAEGVERPGQLEFLARCGPVSVQGFLLGGASEIEATPRDAQAAAARARALLEDAAASAERVADQGSLVFVAPRRAR